MSQAEILHLNEDLVCHVFKTVKGMELAPSASHLREAMERYGSDKPDTRFGLEPSTFSDLVKDSGFKVFLELLQLEVCQCCPFPEGMKLFQRAD